MASSMTISISVSVFQAPRSHGDDGDGPRQVSQERIPEHREPEAFIMDSKHVCPFAPEEGALFIFYDCEQVCLLLWREMTQSLSSKAVCFANSLGLYSERKTFSCSPEV